LLFPESAEEHADHERGLPAPGVLGGRMRRVVALVLTLVLESITLGGPLSAVAGHLGSARGTHAPRVSALESPTELTVVRFKPDVVLRWVHAGHGVTAFEVERAADGGSFTRVASVTREARSFRDRTALAGHAYAYRVRAVAVGLASPYSTEVLASIASERRTRATRNSTRRS
jgi:hypothetical protein